MLLSSHSKRGAKLGYLGVVHRFSLKYSPLNLFTIVLSERQLLDSSCVVVKGMRDSSYPCETVFEQECKNIVT